jgi:hypothetical protein
MSKWKVVQGIGAFTWLAGYFANRRSGDDMPDHAMFMILIGAVLFFGGMWAARKSRS